MIEAILQVTPVAGEAGRYMVQGRTIFCRVCKFSYQIKGDKQAKYAAGDACPKCGLELEPMEYLCDVLLYNGLGKCGCHRWQYYYQPIVAKMSPTERLMAREADEYRCPHLQAALRFFALEFVDRLVASQPYGDAGDAGE